VERARPPRLDAQKKSGRAAEQDRPDVAAARAAWRAAQPGLNPKRLVFLDESGVSTNMARRHGRSPRGRRVAAPVPHGHWKTSTLVAALRHDRVVAPMVIDRPMNGAAFRTYVEQILAPTLAPGDLVLADNLQCHKGAAARAAIEARGAALILLPAYSPDLNPIEQAFAKLKALVRAAAPRSVDALWNTIAACLARFTPEECSNYFANSGYPRLM